MNKTADYDMVSKVIRLGRPTEMFRETGISRNSIYRYRNGKSSIERMPFGDAIKLTEYGRKNGY